jgi:putative membrane protein
MFAWETRGKKVFKGALAPELFKPIKTMAVNLGVYNGFLAAGLIWGLFINDIEWQQSIAIFFLICIALVGIYRGFTASKIIFFIQAMPALTGMLFLIIYKF